MQQKDKKLSKKPQQIKNEEIKQEMPHIQLPASRVEEPIIIDDDSEEDSIYVPKSMTTSSAPLTLNKGGHTSRPQTLVSH